MISKVTNIELENSKIQKCTVSEKKKHRVELVNTKNVSYSGQYESAYSICVPPKKELSHSAPWRSSIIFLI